MPVSERVRVVVGIVVEEGRVLIAQRPHPQSFAHRWEFPGGKVEPGESIDPRLPDNKNRLVRPQPPISLHAKRSGHPKARLFSNSSSMTVRAPEKSRG